MSKGMEVRISKGRVNTERRHRSQIHIGTVWEVRSDTEKMALNVTANILGSTQSRAIVFSSSGY